MNKKIVLAGGLVHYAVMFLASMPAGAVVHQGILKEAYEMTTAFWRPELSQNPPDLAALMPMWIFNGLLFSFVVAGIYSVVHTSLSGAGWLRGLKFGFGLGLLSAAFNLSLSGVFNLPAQIWITWSIEGMVYSLLGGMALGWVAGKLAPAT